MLFGSSKPLIALRVGDKLIRRTKKVKYDGVILDEQLTWGTILSIFQLKLSEILVLSKGQEIRYQRSTSRCCIKLSSSRSLGTATLWGHCGDTLLNRLQALQNRTGAARAISFKKYDNTDHERLLKI